MRVNFPERNLGTVLYEQCWMFDMLNGSEIDALGVEIKAAFDTILREHVGRNSLTNAQYEIVFYRGKLVDWDVFGYPLSEIFCLGSYSNRVLGSLYGGFDRLLEEVREDLMQRPGSLNLDVFVIGYKKEDKYRRVI